MRANTLVLKFKPRDPKESSLAFILFGSRDDAETAGCQEACGENKSPHVTLSTHEVKGKNRKAGAGWDEEVRRRQ